MIVILLLDTTFILRIAIITKRAINSDEANECREKMTWCTNFIVIIIAMIPEGLSLAFGTAAVIKVRVKHLLIAWILDMIAFSFSLGHELSHARYDKNHDLQTFITHAVLQFVFMFSLGRLLYHIKYSRMHARVPRSTDMLSPGNTSIYTTEESEDDGSRQTNRYFHDNSQSLK